MRSQIQIRRITCEWIGRGWSLQWLAYHFVPSSLFISPSLTTTPTHDPHTLITSPLRYHRPLLRFSYEI